MKTESRLWAMASLAALAGALCMFPAQAAEKAAKSADKTAASKAAGQEAAVMARLRKLYPATKFTSVTRTPLPGIYEVIMGENIAYTGPDGRHFLFGHLFDMKTQRDLTAARSVLPAKARAEAAEEDAETNGAVPSKIEVSKLPLDDAIKQVHGDGSRTLVVFSDPRCPYCQRLEAELPTLQNVTIYTFLLPILGPASRTAAEEQWAQARPERKSDLAVLDRNVTLARRLGINGTPTLVRADGQIQAGAVPVAQLDSWLAPQVTTSKLNSSDK